MHDPSIRSIHSTAANKRPFHDIKDTRTEGGLSTHGGGGAPLPPPAAACVALSLLSISSWSFFRSFSRLKVFPRRAFSASAASFSLCGRRESKQHGTRRQEKKKHLSPWKYVHLVYFFAGRTYVLTALGRLVQEKNKEAAKQEMTTPCERKRGNPAVKR